MSSYKKLSNISYTNKEFNTIYPELLDYTKKLSYKWDPTTSDESDPGVVLLKLAALIGDKDSYNIDKNVLELMPASVTQLPAARQLFEQCGYSMHYYRSATGLVDVTINQELGETEELTDVVYNYMIPRFTMFSDRDNSVVFTSTENVVTRLKNTISVPVIEGTLNTYRINNDPLITIQNIDYDNRLYFKEMNIAENGIFITNVSASNSNGPNYSSWERVDNLEIQPKGTRCYKFGLSLDDSLCYIEFPEDVEAIIGEGINLSYIVSSGSSGNVSSRTVTDLYIDTKFHKQGKLLDDELVDVTTEDLTIRNVSPMLNGADPESIDSAYKNYKRTRNTFETLVSLKDYSDFIVTDNQASNGYVCDRTNDIQHSYKVVTTQENNTIVKTKVEQKDSELYTVEKDAEENTTYVAIKQDAMNAFDLCVYALQYIPTVETLETFTESFKVVEKIDDISKDVESLQHDFQAFDNNRILMLQNRYKVLANIVPRVTLSTEEKIQVLTNVEKALCESLNSKEIEFGENISLDTIQQAILKCDERVKALIDFVSPKYETYAIYKTGYATTADGKQGVALFDEIRVDNDSFDGGYVKTIISPIHFSDAIKTYYLDAECTQKLTDKSEWYENIKIYYLDIDKPVEKNNLTKELFDVYKKDYYVLTTKDTIEKLYEGDSYNSDKTYYEWNTDKHNMWLDFRAEIFAKNVLAGVTPLYTDANTYTQGVNQSSIEEYNGVYGIKTNADIGFTLNNSSDFGNSEGDGPGSDSGDEPGGDSGDTTQGVTSGEGAEWESKTLKENENIVVLSPSIVKENSYSSYVKVLYYFDDADAANKTISANLRYTLKEAYDADTGNTKYVGDVVVFFWKESDSSDDYRYRVYSGRNLSKAKIICPTFSLPMLQDLQPTTMSTPKVNRETVKYWLHGLARGNNTDGTTSGQRRAFLKDELDNDIYISETEYLKDYVISTAKYHVLTGNAMIDTYNNNEIHINNNENGCNHFYWILNKSVNGRCTLFNGGSYRYTLKQGEYFMYINDNMTTLHLLGQGTKIIRSRAFTTTGSTSGAWSVPSIKYETLMTEGIDILADKWFIVDKVALKPKIDHNDRSSKAVWACEYEQTQIGSGNTVILKQTSDIDIGFLKITNEGLIMNGGDAGIEEPLNLDDFGVSYRDSEGNIHPITAKSDGSQIVSMLSLDVSPTKSQKLYSNQTVTFYPLNKSISQDSDKSTYLQSKRYLKMVGDYSNSEYTTTYNEVHKTDNFSAILYCLKDRTIHKGRKYTLGEDESFIIFTKQSDSYMYEKFEHSDVGSPVFSSSVYLPKQEYAYDDNTYSESLINEWYNELMKSNTTTGTIIPEDVFISNITDSNLMIYEFLESLSNYQADNGIVPCKLTFYRKQEQSEQSDNSIYNNLDTVMDFSSYTTNISDSSNEATEYIRTYNEKTHSIVIELLPAKNLDSETEVSVPLKEFTLLPGNYLLQLVSLNGAPKLAVSKKFTNNIKPITEGNTTTYTIKLDNKTTFEENSICVVCKNSYQRRVSITIPSLFKYTTDDIDKVSVGTEQENDFEDFLLNKITELDKQNEFAYTYKPKNPIYNPLVSSTFLQENHFYNKFTICQWDTIVDNNVVVHDVVR